MNRLQEKYQQLTPTLQQEFGLKNRMSVPRITKIVVNMGIGDASHDKSKLEKTIATLTMITGQKPDRRAAKKAIAEFRVRQGSVVGLRITLRRQRMYQFLDKLITIVLPRIRDFQGVKKSGFDRQANYNLGLTEQTVFPEVDFDTVDQVRGLNITIATSTSDQAQARRLLTALGMPFEK